MEVVMRFGPSELPYLHVGGLVLQFGQVMRVVLELPTQVRVLLTEILYLPHELVVRRH